MINFRSRRIYSLDIEDLENGRLVWALLISALQADDLAARLAETALLSLLNGELDEVLDALVGRDLKGDNTTGDVELADDVGVGGAGKNRHARAILGDKAGKMACVGQHDDQVDVHVLDR